MVNVLAKAVLLVLKIAEPVHPSVAMVLVMVAKPVLLVPQIAYAHRHQMTKRV